MIRHPWWRRLWWQIAPLLCRHDWHYFKMTRLDGTKEYYRCCLKCEHTQQMAREDWEPGAANE